MMFLFPSWFFLILYFRTLKWRTHGHTDNVHVIMHLPFSFFFLGVSAKWSRILKKVLILNQLQHIRWIKVTSLLEVDKEIFGKYFSWPWPWSAHLKSVISRQTYQRPKFATIWRSRGDVSEKEEEWHRDLIRFEFGRKINLGIVRTYDLEARYVRTSFCI